jgi:protein O-GlcNAc transferase
VPGDTLLIDYAFFTHPTAIGHWWELAAPLYSVLKSAAAAAGADGAADGAADAAAGGAKSGGVARPPDQLVLLHFERRHLAEWARAVAAAALGVGPGEALPPIALQERAPNKYAQIS